MAVFTKYLFCTLPIRRGRLVKSGHPQTGGVGGQPNVDKFGQRGGGGQKIRNFCGCHMWMLPYVMYVAFLPNSKPRAILLGVRSY